MKRIVDIDLPRPRDLRDRRRSEAFGRYVAKSGATCARKPAAACEDDEARRDAHEAPRHDDASQPAPTLARRCSARGVGFGVAAWLFFAVVEFLVRIGVDQPLHRAAAVSRSCGSFARMIAEENCLHRFVQTLQGMPGRGAAHRRVGVPLGVLLYRFALLRPACETWVAAFAAAPVVLMYPLFLVIFGRSA